VLKKGGRVEAASPPPFFTLSSQQDLDLNVTSTQKPRLKTTSRKDLGISLVKEQRIRAQHNIRQLSQRLREQRLKVAARITKRIGIRGGGGGMDDGGDSGSDTDSGQVRTRCSRPAGAHTACV
jgi:hypothetical protein